MAVNITITDAPQFIGYAFELDTPIRDINLKASGRLADIFAYEGVSQFGTYVVEYVNEAGETADFFADAETPLTILDFDLKK